LEAFTLLVPAFCLVMRGGRGGGRPAPAPAGRTRCRHRASCAEAARGDDGPLAGGRHRHGCAGRHRHGLVGREGALLRPCVQRRNGTCCRATRCACREGWRFARTCPSTISNVPCAQASRKLACGTAWPARRLSKSLPVPVSTGCWSTWNIRPTTCRCCTASCRHWPRTRPPARWCARHGTMPWCSSACWTWACRPS